MARFNRSYRDYERYRERRDEERDYQLRKNCHYMLHMSINATNLDQDSGDDTEPMEELSIFKRKQSVDSDDKEPGRKMRKPLEDQLMENWLEWRKLLGNKKNGK